MEKIVAPCGIDCFNCEMYEKNVTEEFQARFAERFKVPKERISCAGCIGSNQCLLLDLQGKKCSTLECVKKKGIQYCFECDTFPCEYLMPVADGAQRVPHNMKVYNLCRMKLLGVEQWTEEVGKIRHAYFNKTFGIGEGGSNP